MRDGVMPSDPSKPLPDDVLRTLSLGLEFEKKLIGLCGETKNTLALNPLEKNVKLLQSMTSTTDEGNLVGLGHTNTDNIDGEPLKYSNEKEIMGSLPPQGSIREKEIPTEGGDTSIQPAIIETLNPKVIHYEFACLSLKHNFSFDHVTLWGPCLFYGTEHGGCNTVLIAFLFFLSVSLNPPLSLAFGLTYRIRIMVFVWLVK